MKHGTGNINTADGEDYSLDDADKGLMLQRRGTDWYEIARSQPFDPETGYLLYQNTATSGTAGPTFAAGAWRTVPLDSEKVDTGDNGSLASNTITLAAGEYLFWGSMTAANGGNTTSARLRLQNTSDGTTIAQGSPVRTNDTVATFEFTALVMGRFSIAAAKAVQLQVYANGSGLDAANAVSTGSEEVYASLLLHRVA